MTDNGERPDCHKRGYRAGAAAAMRAAPPPTHAGGGACIADTAVLIAGP
jgi:hypothetical protein